MDRGAWWAAVIDDLELDNGLLALASLAVAAEGGVFLQQSGPHKQFQVSL